MKGFDSNYSPLLVASQQSSVDRLKKEKKDIEKEQRETEAKVDRLKYQMENKLQLLIDLVLKFKWESKYILG
jgi:prefoldin subunit 5